MTQLLTLNLSILIADLRAWGRMQVNIIWALLLRELATRYGRDNIGFLWAIGEPLMFCAGVTVMWSLIRPPYEEGIRLYTFIITGYLPLTLLRHTISQGILCIKINSNLLYHKKITPLHFFICRSILEFVGVSITFVIIVSALHLLGLMDLPSSLSFIYIGWILLWVMSFGIALILGSLASVSEVMERASSLISYVLIPVSGAFYFVAWLPYQYRAAVLKIPLVNCVELIRRGFVGEFYPTYFNIEYAFWWAIGFVFVGLILLSLIRNKIEVD